MKQVFALIIVICFLLPVIPPTPAVNGQTHYTMRAEQQSTYHSYDSMRTELEGVAENHPGIVSMFSIGTTYEGRDIWAVKISDNPNADESDEPDVLYMGAHHGNEKTSYEVLIYFINYVVEKYYENSNEGGRVRYVVNNRELYIVPMVNPDGVDAGERKNREPNYMPGPMHTPYPDCYGVDLNRNYDYMWGIFPYPANSANPYSNTYEGEEPFSEKETQAVRDFVGNHDFVLSLSYHTYSELVLYPWGYTTQPPPDEELFQKIGEGITQINGYKTIQASDPDEMYLTSGDSDDWLYGEKGVLAFTIELGKEHSPEYDEVLNISKTHAGVNLYVAEIADNPEGEWVIRVEKPKEDKGSIFDDTLGSFATMSAMMMIMFGVVWGGLAKCIGIAVKSEKMKVKHGKMEK